MDTRYVPFKVVTGDGKTIGTFPNIVFAHLFLAALLEHDIKDVSIQAIKSEVNPFEKISKFFGLDEVQGDLDL